MQNKIKFLFFGILAALGALALESFVLIFPEISPSTGVPDWFMPLGVFIEEAFSLLILWRLFVNEKNRSGFFCETLFFGAGFSLTEILLNAANYPKTDESLLFSYLGLFLIHTAAASIAGAYFSRKETVGPGIGLVFFAAAFAHFIFNYSVLFELGQSISIIWPIIVILASFFAKKSSFSHHSLPTPGN